MNASRIPKVIIALVALSTLNITISPYVFADEASSTHFIVKNGDMNNFGGFASSSNFSSVESGGQTQSGTSTSASFALDAGQLYFDTFSPVTQNWRWYDDETNETPTSPLASENVAPSSINANTVKLRISVAETAHTGEPAAKFRLQYSTASDFSSDTHDVVEQWSCTGASNWCYADGAGVDNVVITTKLITGSDSCAGSVGTGCGTHNESGTSTSAFTQAASTTAEYEFTIQNSGATINTVYFFRLFDTISSSSVPVNAKTSATYPSLATGGTTLDFSINGIATSTFVSGLATDFTTTSTNVPFGKLPVGLGTSVKGAHRLTVTTNAAQGYEIFAYERQGFSAGSGDEITPLPGTNSTPVSWNTSNCPSSTSGCYGYHTTESVLASAPATRFVFSSITTP